MWSVCGGEGTLSLSVPQLVYVLQHSDACYSYDSTAG